MLLRRLLGVAAAGLLTLSASVAAQEFAVGITPFGAAVIHNGKLPSSFLILGRESDREVQNGEWDNGKGLGSAITFWVKNRYIVEFAASYTSHTLHSTNQPDISADIFTVSGNVAYSIPLFGAGRELFIGGGAGVKNYDWFSDSSKAETDFTWNAGGGLNIALSRRLGVRVEGRDYISTFGSRQSGVESAKQHDIVVLAGLTLTVRNLPGRQ